MRLPCSFCGEPVDPTADGVGREVTGWEKIRAQGGANSIIARTETGRIACAKDLGMLRQGLDPTAQSTFL